MKKSLEEIEKNHKSELHKIELKAQQTIHNAKNEANIIKEKYQMQMNEANGLKEKFQNEIKELN